MSAEQAELLTVDEAAKLLLLHPKTIYVMIAQNRLPGVRRLGRTIRFHRATLVGWLASGDQRVSRARRKP